MNKKLLIKSIIIAACLTSSTNALAYNSGFYTRFSFATSKLVKTKQKNSDIYNGTKIINNFYATRKSNIPIYGLGFGLNLGGGFLAELMMYKNKMSIVNPVTTGIGSGDYTGSPLTLPTTAPTVNYNPLSWNSFTPMIQIYYEIVRLGPISPYIMLGGGLSRQVLQGMGPATTPDTGNGNIPMITQQSFKKKKTGISYAVGVGMNILTSRSLDFDISYKIFGFTKVTTSKVLGNNFAIKLNKGKYHVLECGLKYWF